MRLKKQLLKSIAITLIATLITSTNRGLAQNKCEWVVPCDSADVFAKRIVNYNYVSYQVENYKKLQIVNSNIYKSKTDSLGVIIVNRDKKIKRGKFYSRILEGALSGVLIAYLLK